MKARSLVVTPAELDTYLQTNWRGFDTKDYELATALILAKVYSEHLKKAFRIGFPVKYRTETQDLDNTPENIALVLSSYLDEETPIDLFLVAEDAIGAQQSHSRIGRVKGHAFQLKRFMSNELDNTGPLLQFLTVTIPNKYAPVQAVLVVIVSGGQTDGKVDLSVIKNNFCPQNYPFERVLFVAGDNRVMHFAELWPNFGRQEFPHPFL